MAIVYVRGANPIWYLPDLVGNPLNDEYYAFFLTNELPYLPQSVYKGFVFDSKTHVFPIQFQPGGTLPDNLYFDPTLVYRIEIRHGDTQEDQLIYEINNYAPSDVSQEDTTNAFDNSENMVSNPQFLEVNFIGDLTYTTGSVGTHTLDIAPGWKLELTGSGTTTLSVVEIPGTDNISGNPPTALQIMNTGWTESKIYQRFENNGAIFANGTIAMSVSVRSYISTAPITLSYVPSLHGTPIQVAEGIAMVGDFSIIKSAALTGPSTNENTGSAAYVDMVISIPPTGKIDITNIQFIGQEAEIDVNVYNSLELTPDFFELTYERQLDFLFHYYKSKLIFKPIPSYTLGWDFTSNPCQELGRTVGVVAVGPSTYVADQTILFQSTTSRANVSFTNEGFQIAVVTGAASFGVIQYLDALDADDLLTGRSSAQLNAKVSVGNLSGTVSLWWTAEPGLPDIKTPNYLSPVTVITNGEPTCGNGAWNQIPRPNRDSNFAKFTLNTTLTAYDLDGFDASSVDTSTAKFFAIIIAFDSYDPGNNILLNYCSLCTGDIATEPAPMNFSQTLSGLEYYYQKSYATGTVAPTITTDNCITGPQSFFVKSSSLMAFLENSFTINYRCEMRDIPVLSIYSPDSLTPDRAKLSLKTELSAADNTTTVSSQYNINVKTKTANYDPKTVAEVFNTSGHVASSWISYHYIADARLGVV